MDVPKYIHYDFVPQCQCRYYKKGSKLTQRAEIDALPPERAWDKTFSAKIINKKPFKGVPYIMCVIELDMVRAQQGWEQYKVGQGLEWYKGRVGLGVV